MDRPRFPGEQKFENGPFILNQPRLPKKLEHWNWCDEFSPMIHELTFAQPKLPEPYAHFLWA
jgi:hypothetical protein